MEEFVLSPPTAILYFAGGLFLVAVASIFLKRGQRTRKAIGVGIAALAAVLIAIIAWRPVRIDVGDDGIAIHALSSVDLAWNDVQSAVFANDLRASVYRPSVRTGGIVFGDYRSGRFLLSNGTSARVYMARSDEAVVIKTSNATYLLAPQDVEGLADAIARHRNFDGVVQ